ncbi:MAG: class D sortase [Candidatus Saccharimonadales bacterium]
MDLKLDDHPDQFSESLPLPPEPGQPKAVEPPSAANPAADLIRKRVEDAYLQEPDVAAEVAEVTSLSKKSTKSKHQQFILELTGSGKSLPEIQVAWHEYYASLSDSEKHQVWQEFYESHSESAKFPKAERAKPDKSARKPKPAAHRQPTARARLMGWGLGDLRDSVLGDLPSRPAVKIAPHWRSAGFGLAVGLIAVFIFLFSFFNERIIAPLIQPSRTVSSTPIINAAVAGSLDPKIIIPKINVEIPVVYDVGTIEESAVLKALEGGVVHYADTAQPGQNGNTVIVGHSSNNIFNSGRYKFAFVLLSRLEKGDTFYLQKDGKRFTYQIYDKKVIKPTDVSVLGQTDKPATASLITCDPPGTSTNRLVVVGEQINPDTKANAPAAGQGSLASSTKIVPGNAPTLWSKIAYWLSR